MQKTCHHCQAVYEAPPSQKPKYCSAKCSGAAKRKGSYVVCLQCGESVWSHPSRPKRYCSKSCARTALNLTDANPSKHRDLSGSNNPAYGKRLYGSKNGMFGMRGSKAPAWKGGRKKRKDGYVFVRVRISEDEFSLAEGTWRYELEHRVVMSKVLGRALEPEEVVHHIDGNPSNNDPSNLLLCANQAEHARLHKTSFANDLNL